MQASLGSYQQQQGCRPRGERLLARVACAVACSVDAGDDADRGLTTKKVARGKEVGLLQSINSRGRSRFDAVITKTCLSHLFTRTHDYLVQCRFENHTTTHGKATSSHYSCRQSPTTAHIRKRVFRSAPAPAPTHTRLLQRLCICREQKIKMFAAETARKKNSLLPVCPHWLPRTPALFRCICNQQGAVTTCHSAPLRECDR